MLSQLLEDARSLRVPILAGFSVLVTGWILLFDQVPYPAEPSEGLQALQVIWDELGVGGRISVVTFVATMLGQMLGRLGLVRAMELIGELLGGPDWEKYISLSESDLERLEKESYFSELEARASSGRRFEGGKYVTPTELLRAQNRVLERRKEQEESVFRIALAMAVVPPAIALAVRGLEMRWLPIALVVVPVLDLVFLRRAAVRELSVLHLGEINSRLARITEEIEARPLHEKVFGNQGPEMTSVSDLKKELEGLEKQKSKIVESRWYRRMESKGG